MICDEWRHSFQSFFKEVGPRPTPKHTIERKNNNKGYEPGNVVWATRSEQAKNRRSTVLITIDGITLCLKDWARKVGINYVTLKDRIRNGWSPEKAILTPTVTKYSRKHLR